MQTSLPSVSFETLMPVHFAFWILHFAFCILHVACWILHFAQLQTIKVLEASQRMMMSRDLKTDQTYVLLHRSLRRDWWDWEIRFRRKVPTALSLVEKSKKAFDWPISTNQGPSNINQSEIFMQPIRDFHTPFDQSEGSRNFPSKSNFSLPSVSSETLTRQDMYPIASKLLKFWSLQM